MRKYISYVTIFIMISFIVLISAFSQEDMTHISNEYFTNPQRPPSVFNHEEHNETAEIEECNECHHLYEDGKKLEDESSEDQLCADCHQPASTERQPSLMRAFHLNCKGCHKQKSKGPVMCGECHVNM